MIRRAEFWMAPALALLIAAPALGAEVPAEEHEQRLPPPATSLAPPEPRGGVAPAPSLTSSVNAQWAGISFEASTNNHYPPDTHGAAGASGILATCNVSIAYYNRAGTAIWGPMDLHAFFGIAPATYATDPRAIYDPGSGRFFVIMHTANFSTYDTAVSLAVSKSSNPATGTSADWHFYGFYTTEYDALGVYGVDYPGLGVDAQAVYATYNMVAMESFNPSGFLHSRIMIFDKAAVIAGTSSQVSVFTPYFIGETIQPCSALGAASPGNVAYFTEAVSSSTTQVRLWALQDPLGARTLSSTTLTVPNHGGGTGFAPQPAPGGGLHTLSPRTQGNAFWFNGNAWFCHTAGGLGGPSKVYFYKVSTNGYPSGTPAVAEAGEIGSGTDAWNYQPAIGGNTLGDVAMVFTQSSPTINPAILFTVRAAASNAFEPPTLLKASPTIANMQSARWGDYATVSADPADNTFWVAHEWARSTATNDWGTWWGNVSVSAAVADLVLQNLTVTGTAFHEASHSITAGPAVTLASTSNVTFHVIQPEGYITLANGFWAQSGGTFRAYIAGGAGGGAPPPGLRPPGGDSKPVAIPMRAFPNPSRGELTIEFELPTAAEVQIEVFDLQGRKVAALQDGSVPAGRHGARWDASAIRAGVYYYRLAALGLRQEGRIVVLK